MYILIHAMNSNKKEHEHEQFTYYEYMNMSYINKLEHETEQEYEYRLCLQKLYDILSLRILTKIYNNEQVDEQEVKQCIREIEKLEFFTEY